MMALSRVTAEVAELYLDGCIEFLEEHHPELTERIDRKEQAVLRYYMIDLDHFSYLLNEWRESWCKAIKLYKEWPSSSNTGQTQVQ